RMEPAMNGFVVTAPGPVDEEPTIENEDFWPAIEPGACRDVMRLDQTITPARLREALVNAMINTNGNLADWQASQLALEYNQLDAVPAPRIDGSSQLISLYHRAVYCFAKAELMERYRDYDSTLRGDRRSDDMGDGIDDYRRQAIIAIRNISGEPHTTVELI
ncbi:MAG: head completion/stabilization protein, partial [Marinobacterium sp.]|nr:head completion/stabilization protein [Marinobacterium sp.]